MGTYLISLVGCRPEAAAPPPAVAEHSSPAESFEEIVKVFENGMELPGSNLSDVFRQDTGASSRIQVHNTVTSELIPPASADEPYRGTITVSSQSVYSMRRAVEDKDESEDDDYQQAAGSNAFGTESSNTEFQSFDQGLIANAPKDEKKAESSETPIVQRRPEKDDRTYELLYRDGRWELITKLDPKTERSVANAFDRALRHQP